MNVRIMETTPERAEAIARDWGINPCAGQALDVIHAAIAAAYHREVDAEARAEAERLRAELLRVVEHADMAPELYASDADVWRGMADIARAALAKEPNHDC